MIKTAVIPKVFQKEQKLEVGKRRFSLLNCRDISCVKYFHDDNRHKSHVVVTTYLFVIVLNGRKIMHTACGDYTIEAGNAFFAKKDSYMYSEFISNDKPFESLIFFISDAFLSEFLKNNSHLFMGTILPESSCGIFPIEPTPLFKASLTSIQPYFEDQSAHTNEILRMKFMETLLHIVESDRQGSFLSFLKSIYSARRKDLIYLMEENYAKPLNVEEYARLSGRSLSTFKKEFSSIFQQSPKKWINAKRLARARSLLTSTEKNVTQVCFEVGFENISYFTQLFKKYFGITPKQLQKHHSITIQQEVENQQQFPSALA